MLTLLFASGGRNFRWLPRARQGIGARKMKRKNPLRELLNDLQAEAQSQKDEVDPRRALLNRRVSPPQGLEEASRVSIRRAPRHATVRPV